MPDSWLQTTLQTLAKTGLGTVLCLGRGLGPCIEALPTGAAQQILQLEPDPKQARHLQSKYGEAVTVLPSAFADTKGSRDFLQLSMAGLSGLRPATGLQDLFPGLRETGTLEVTTCTAADLAAQLTLDPTGAHLLILGAPGEEESAIRQWADLGLLTRFDHILTPLPPRPLYEGAADGTTLRTLLNDAGFHLERQDMSDPDRPLAWLRRDPRYDTLIAEADALRADLATARKETAELKATLDARTAERDAHVAEADALRTDLAAVREEAAELKSKLDASTGERDNRVAEADALRADLATARKETAELKARLDARTAERDAHVAEADALRTDLAAVRKETAHTPRLTQEMTRLDGQLALLHTLLASETLS